MPLYPARNPANTSRSCAENTGSAGTPADEVVVVVVVIAYIPASGRGRTTAPAVNDHLNLRTHRQPTKLSTAPLDAPERRLRARRTADWWSRHIAQIRQFWSCAVGLLA